MSRINSPGWCLKDIQGWFLTDSEWQISVIFLVKFLEVPKFRGTEVWFSAPFAKSSGKQKISCSIFLRAKGTTKTRNFGFLSYCSKIQRFQNFQKHFPFSTMNFQNLFKKIEFLLSFWIILEKFTFPLMLGISFWWPLHTFLSLLTTLSHFDILIYMC